MPVLEPDWALWRSFAAVVEEGSLSAAARKLRLSQPTVGRHIEALEYALDATLFERTLTGVKPGDMALKLFEQVALARRAFSDATMMAEGERAGLTGVVRITASTVTAHYSLPPMLARLRAEFPAIAIDLVPTDSPENLLIRESDIAVRMFRPTQLELITRKIAESRIFACAHRAYLNRRGTPQTPDELADHDLIGFDRSDLLIRVARQMGMGLRRDDFIVRTDSQTAGWELMKAGLGIGFAQEVLIGAHNDMVSLLPDLDIPPLEVWLTTHRELFTSRRIRVIYDRLGEMLAEYYS